MWLDSHSKKHLQTVELINFNETIRPQGHFMILTYIFWACWRTRSRWYYDVIKGIFFVQVMAKFFPRPIIILNHHRRDWQNENQNQLLKTTWNYYISLLNYPRMRCTNSKGLISCIPIKNKIRHDMSIINYVL